MHKDKFVSAVEGGFGFCDVVFGWDSQDVCYDNTKLTGWHKGFPDALARIDLGTHPPRAVGRQRAVLPGRVRLAEGRQGSAVSAVPAAGAEARAEARGEARASCRCAAWNSSGSTSPRRRNRGPRRKASGPEPITLRHVRLFAAARQRGAAVLRGAVQRNGRVRRADRGPAHGDRARACTKRRSCSRKRSSRRTARSCSRRAPRKSRRASTSCRASWRSGASSIRAARATSTSRCPTARPTSSTIPRASTG